MIYATYGCAFQKVVADAIGADAIAADAIAAIIATPRDAMQMKPDDEDRQAT